MGDNCPLCGSPSPERHPAVQCEGEVELCTHDFHLRPTNMNKPEYIEAVLAKRDTRPIWVQNEEHVGRLADAIDASRRHARGYR